MVSPACRLASTSMHTQTVSQKHEKKTSGLTGRRNANIQRSRSRLETLLTAGIIGRPSAPLPFDEEGGSAGSAAAASSAALRLASPLPLTAAANFVCTIRNRVWTKGITLTAAAQAFKADIRANRYNRDASAFLSRFSSPLHELRGKLLTLTAFRNQTTHSSCRN